MKKFTIEDRETGNWKIDDCDTLDEALSAIEYYENLDKKATCYEPNSYAIRNNETDEIQA